jgi:phosphatidylglycerophosphate synthase
MKLYDNERVLGGLKRDVVTTRLLFDPIAIPLTGILLRWSWLKPNHLTVTAFFVGIVASFLFAFGMPIYGGLAYYVFFLFDRMDGTLARAKSCFHPLGRLFDFVSDRNIVWLMSLSSAYDAYCSDQTSVAALYMGYISLFLLKDVWANEVSVFHESAAQANLKGILCKTHFKPGQVLSCHLAFLIAPLTGWYHYMVGGALLCVLISLLVNGLLPLLSLIRKYGFFSNRSTH